MFFLRSWPTRIGAEGYITGICGVTGSDALAFTIVETRDIRGFPYPAHHYEVYGPEDIQRKINSMLEKV